MRYLYCAALYLLTPFLLLSLLYKSVRTPAYRTRIAERFGYALPSLTDGVPVIWVHAASVGEVHGAAPLIDALLADYPTHTIVLSSVTPTGAERVQALYGDRVRHVYAPWDLPYCVQRTIDSLRPSLLILVETELWPNLIHHCYTRGCPVVLVNGRMSQRSAAGYARFSRLTKPMLKQLDWVACPSKLAGQRFLKMGLPAHALKHTKDLKFDSEKSPELQREADSLRECIAAGSRPIVLAASTHYQEEALILEAFQAVREYVPDSLLLLAPRHPPRFDAVVQQCHALGRQLGWRVNRRSDLGPSLSSLTAPQPATPQPATPQPATPQSPPPAIIVVDTLGELPALYGLATVALVGGSWAEHGGHNPLEAALWGTPVITGPHLFNFEEVTQQLEQEGALQVTQNAESLSRELVLLMTDSDQRDAMARAAQSVLSVNRGGTQQIMLLIAGVMKKRIAN